MDYLKSFGIKKDKDVYKKEMIYGVLLINNIITKIASDFFSNYKLTAPTFNVLMVIKHAGGKSGISQADISKRLILTPSNMTRILDRLEKRGLIKRISHKTDRRVNVIKVTKKASNLLDKIWPAYTEKIKYVANHMSKNEQKTIAKILLKWFEKLVKYNGE